MTQGRTSIPRGVGSLRNGVSPSQTWKRSISSLGSLGAKTKKEGSRHFARGMSAALEGTR